MALPSVRMEFRVALTDADRGVSAEDNVLLARHPSETQEHVVLRVLAWCLLWEPDLRMGPELCAPDAPDLWVHDPTGRIVSWIECGTADAEELRRVVQHHGAAVHVLFDRPVRRQEFLSEVDKWNRKPKGWAPVIWTVDPELVRALAARDDRRQRWSVTITGGRLYVEADGDLHEGEAVREDPAPE